MDKHRVGSFVVFGLEDCWLRGVKVTSQFLIGTKDGTLERRAAAIYTPAFDTFGGARRLEIDVHKIFWDIDSVEFKVVWRAVACEL